MTEEKGNKSSGQIRPHVKAAFENILKGRSELYQKLARTDRRMEIADQIMDENRDVLKRLADS
jgi:hypothetical protein